jgi:formate dehydrogenase subunit gamma
MEDRTRWTPEAVISIAESLKERPGPLMLILHRIQEEFGHIPRESVPLIASVLNLSRAEVHGVVSFYHDFKAEPAGLNLIQLCRAESCQAVGAAALEEHAKRRLGVDFKETTADGRFTLEPVYCLGLCACSPAMMVNGTPHGKVDSRRFDDVVAALASEPQ